MGDYFKENILKRSNSYNFYKSEYNRLKKEKSISNDLNTKFSEVNNELKDIEKKIGSVSGSLSGRVDVVSKNVEDGFSSVVGNLDDGFRDISGQLGKVSDDIGSVSGSLSGRVDVVSGRLDVLDKSVVDGFNELSSVNQNFKEELVNLKEDLSLIREDIKNHFEFIDKYLKSELAISQNLLKEIQYSEIFRDTIVESNWLLDKSFSLNNSAANYSFFYILYRILNEVKPLNILELGLGQTTKMTAQYVSYYNDSKLQVIENNPEWINKFSNRIALSDNIKINQVDLIKVLINSNECLKYKNFDGLLGDTLFDLIIVDGPLGYGQLYPRTNVLDIVEYIADDFVIIIDDYDRIGEQNTAKKLFEILNEKKIEFGNFIFRGLKHQLVIYSPKNIFVSWF